MQSSGPSLPEMPQMPEMPSLPDVAPDLSGIVPDFVSELMPFAIDALGAVPF